jgi:hypothetical protein
MHHHSFAFISLPRTRFQYHPHLLLLHTPQHGLTISAFVTPHCMHAWVNNATSDLNSAWRSALLTFCDGLRNCVRWRLGAFSPILRPSEAHADKWTPIFEFKSFWQCSFGRWGFMMRPQLCSRKSRGPSHLLWMGRGVVIVVCYACVRVLLASSLLTNQLLSLSHYPHTKQSLRCSFVLELERRQIQRKEVRVEEVMGLIRDFAVDLGIWKEGRGWSW